MKSIFTTVVCVVFQIICSAQDFPQGNDKWTSWHTDSTFNGDNKLVAIAKSKKKCPTTTCEYYRIVTLFNEQGKWYFKEKTYTLRGCYNRKEKIIWTKRRQKREPKQPYQIH